MPAFLLHDPFKQERGSQDKAVQCLHRQPRELFVAGTYRTGLQWDACLTTQGKSLERFLIVCSDQSPNGVNFNKPDNLLGNCNVMHQHSKSKNLWLNE
jgi:hypothetical protein